jgi:titin
MTDQRRAAPVALLLAIAVAACGGGSTSPGQATPPDPKTATPTNLVATYTTATSIHLTWTNNAVGATGILVERSTAAAGPFGAILTAPGVATSADDATVVAGTRYYFRLTALSPVSSGTPSAVVTVDPLVTPPSPTATPTNLVGIYTSTTAIHLTWTNNAVGATGMRVERATAAAGPFTTVVTAAGTANSADDTTLVSGTTYSFRVTALNGLAAGTPSAVLTVTPPSGPPSPTATPTNLVVAYSSATSVHLTWTNNAVGATGIRVERATAAAGPFTTIVDAAGTPVTVAGTAVSADDARLTLSTQYWYRATALNGGTAGTPSAVATVAPPPVPSAPAAPTGLTVTNPSGMTLKVDWTHSGTNVKGFRVERLMNFTGWDYVKVADLPATARTFSDPCLRPGSPFLYKVTAFNEVGAATVTSAANTFTPAPTVAPVATSGPSALVATQLTADSYRVSWTNSCTTADLIRVEYADGPGYTTWINLLGASDFASDATWFIYTDLPPGTVRRIRVSGRNVFGSTNFSNLVQTDGPAVAPPATSGSIGIYADYDNTKVYTDILPATNATVYSSGGLSAGCFWSFNTFLGMQDFMCYSAAIHFPLSGTNASGVAFNLAGKTIDRAYFALNVSSVSINPTNLQVGAIASAWNTTTLTGNTSLNLYTTGGSLQGSPVAFGPYVFNVTSIVQAWVTGSFVNNGLLLEDAEYVFPYGDYIRTSFFFSTDTFAGDQNKRPTLWVDYH